MHENKMGDVRKSWAEELGRGDEKRAGSWKEVRRRAGRRSWKDVRRRAGRSSWTDGRTTTTQ